MHSLVKSQLAIYYANLKYYNPVDLKKELRKLELEKLISTTFKKLKK